MSAQPFSWLDTTKICFLPEHDALFKEFFYLYQSFNTKIRIIIELIMGKECLKKAFS